MDKGIDIKPSVTGARKLALWCFYSLRNHNQYSHQERYPCQYWIDLIENDFNSNL